MLHIFITFPHPKFIFIKDVSLRRIFLSAQFLSSDYSPATFSLKLVK